MFNPLPKLVTSNYIFKTEVSFRKSIPEIPSVNTNNNQVQDMGLDGLDVQVVGLAFRATDDTANSNINKIKRFMKERGKTTGYTKGRFGLRNDRIPQFNVVPTSTFGYILQEARIIDEGNRKDKVGIMLVLRLGGDIDSAI